MSKPSPSRSRRSGPGCWQQTLKHSVTCRGIGLHSGAAATLSVWPAAPNHGVAFRRIDLPGRPTVPARWDRVSDLTLCTTLLGENGARVSTVEHLLAALAGMGVDNALVELDGPEVPIMDGSAAAFVELIESVGLIEQLAPRRYIKLLRTVEAGGGARSASLSPAPDFSVSFAIDFASPAIGEQDCAFTVTPETFKAEIARARTFGFLHEVDALRRNGKALGGSLDNAVVVAEDRVLNRDGLRYANEFARHKALDAIGDLFLAGAPMLAAFRGDQSGHALNNRLLRELFADQTAWEWTTLAPAARTRRAAPALHGAVATA